MEKKYTLDGLDCASCAAKIEQAVTKLPGVEKATVDFATTRMSITCEKDTCDSVEEEATKLIKKLEPEVTVRPVEKKQNQEEAGESRQVLLRILVTGGLFFGLVLLQPKGLWQPILSILTYLLIGGDIVKKAVSNIFQGEIFDENFLMTVATVGALAIGEYPEAIAVMWLYQIGEFFQDYAVDRSRKNVQALMDVRPDTARIRTDEGEKIVSPEEVAVGSVVVVNPGERVPLDGIVAEGSGYVDTSALTGESVPQFLEPEQEILSGSINQEGRLAITVTKPFAEATVSKILDLVENASSQKAPAEKFITKFARYYTPAVVGLAALLVILPTVFFQQDFHEWLYRALTFLVISCPCALVISVPLSFFGGIGGASKAGILIKGSNYLETLATVETVVFDKTGTLTEGRFALQQIETNLPEDEFLTYTAAVEQYSTHPIARSIVDAASKFSLPKAVNLQEIAGQGIQASVNGKQVLVGNEKLFSNVQLPRVEAIGTTIYVAIDQQFVGYLVIADQIKEDAAKAIQDLRQAGVKNTVMLTGDNHRIGEYVGKKLGLSHVFSELLPEDKVAHLTEIMKEKGNVAFVGDGINDAPVLATADVGVAMGGLGSDAAIEAADVVIMNDAPSKLATAIRLSRKTLRIVKQNIVFALAVKAVVLVLGAIGFASMGAAVFADVGVTLLAVLNAMRCLRVKE